MNIITDLLKQLLGFLFHFTGDWGVTIILLTIVVRVALMPLSVKQKLGMEKQQDVSQRLAEIKKKYEGDEEKIQQESQKHYAEAAKGMLGCMTILLQMPVIFALYRVVTQLPYEAGTVLVPWISNIKAADGLFILPVVYVIVTCIPSLLPYMPYIKSAYRAKASKAVLATNAIFSAIIIVKAPVALGMYFITTSLFSAIEELGFRIYIRHKLTAQM